MNKVLGYRKMINKSQKEMGEHLSISEQAYRNKEKGRVTFKKDEMIKFRQLLVENGLIDIRIENIFFD